MQVVSFSLVSNVLLYTHTSSFEPGVSGCKAHAAASVLSCIIPVHDPGEEKVLEAGLTG